MEPDLDPQLDDPVDETPPDPGATPPNQPSAPPVRYLRRNPSGPIAGVATGIADYLRVQPIVVQSALVALTVFGGSGILVYIAGWLLIPELSDPEPRPVAITSDPVRIFFGIFFAIGAASTLFGSISFGLGANVVIPMLIIAAGFYFLNQRAEALPPTAAAPPPPGQGFTPPMPPAPTPAPAAAPAPTWTAAPAPSHWASARTEDDVAIPAPPSEPTVPVTSITLAIAALAVGTLIAVDQWTSATIGAAALFGTALAIVGGGLVFSAFRGRALPLIPIGLLLGIGLITAPLSDATISGGAGERFYQPVEESAVRSTYDLGAGPLELDLRFVDFTEDHVIEVNVGAGYAEIDLPVDVNIEVEATSTAGYVNLFGRESAGIGADLDATRSAQGPDIEPADAPTVVIKADVTFGYVEVNRG